MSESIDIIALVFDFDDTIVPDSTSLFLKSLGVDIETFWSKEVKKLVADGYEPTLAYLRKLLDHIGINSAIKKCCRSDLLEFGKNLESQIYPGFKDLLPELKEQIREFKNVNIEYYVISGGLIEFVEGCSFLKTNLSGFYGSQFAADDPSLPFQHIKRSISFTEKTRYLFEIHKGISISESGKNPYLVNREIPMDKRRIPWKNFIYIGDGLSDIPSFSLIKKEGGQCIGVFDPMNKESAKRVLMELLIPSRTQGAHAPHYEVSYELGSHIRSLVTHIASRIENERYKY